MNTTKADILFVALIFMGIAMAEPTLEKQFEQGLNEDERAFFYTLFAQSNEQNEKQEQDDNE
ncbi:MAG: hypothetical protein Tp185DCM00d2C31949971_1 [Prokaryotic dsDNA virus sp.]|uniref:hypothetical protein n=1 Tax=Gammaproteobacteria TaxID=1236 RepID=UPI00118A93AC|nr:MULTISPECIES: hypothetical protein [Gammaproteobacteria]QDP60885.1 MAG: hypothetical protein Tp185DCM00d2C31949971_1 [Prokaryotic dsDNA virus sp.]QDP61780.1 MAG: hypothetical protein Tp1111MES1053591_19 [Prokaryotic dsDNA virus sp.]|tara:strand:+ start:163 stop:348 length:186 start_codon:yes stop_codon:yes gene_type:complete